MREPNTLIEPENGGIIVLYKGVYFYNKLGCSTRYGTLWFTKLERESI